MSMVCGRCGGDDVYRSPPDYIDYCEDCGIIEGLNNEGAEDE